MMEGSRLASCFFLLILLFPLMITEGRREVGMDEIDERRKQNEMKDFVEATSTTQNPIIKMVTQMEDVTQNSQVDHHQIDLNNNNNNNNGHSSSSSHMDHINPLTKVFFTINDLKVGQKLPIYFPKRDPSKAPPFLPKEKADSIPFSFKQLPQILSFFSFPSNSPQAQAVKETLQQCELKPIVGETKFCATSMESMEGFVRTFLMLTPKSSSSSSVKRLKTSHITKSNVHFQNYTIFDTPKKIAAPKLVACHTVPYPYAVYYCHYQEGDNNVLKIALEGENGDRVDSIAICHMDTSQWSPSHPSFQLLKTQPGAMPVCHFFPADDFVWIPGGAAA